MATTPKPRTPEPPPTAPPPPAPTPDGGEEIDVPAEAEEEDDGVSASLDSGSNKRSWIRFGSIVYGLPCILSSLSR